MSFGSEHAQGGVIWSGLNGTHGYRPGFILPRYVTNVLTSVCSPVLAFQKDWLIVKDMCNERVAVDGCPMCCTINHMLAAKPRSPIRAFQAGDTINQRRPPPAGFTVVPFSFRPESTLFSQGFSCSARCVRCVWTTDCEKITTHTDRLETVKPHRLTATPPHKLPGDRSRQHRSAVSTYHFTCNTRSCTLASRTHILIAVFNHCTLVLLLYPHPTFVLLPDSTVSF